MLDVDERFAQLGFHYTRSPREDYVIIENKGSLKGTSTDDPIWSSSQESIVQTIQGESSQDTIETLVPIEEVQPAQLKASPSYFTVSSSFLGLEWKIPSMIDRAPGGDDDCYPYTTFLKNPIVSQSGFGFAARAMKTVCYNPPKNRNKLQNSIDHDDDDDRGSTCSRCSTSRGRPIDKSSSRYGIPYNGFKQAIKYHPVVGGSETCSHNQKNPTNANKDMDKKEKKEMKKREKELQKQNKKKKKGQVDCDCDPETAPICTCERTKNSCKKRERKDNDNYYADQGQAAQECTEQDCPILHPPNNYPEAQYCTNRRRSNQSRSRSPKRVCSNCQHISQSHRESRQTKGAKSKTKNRRYYANDVETQSDYLEFGCSRTNHAALRNPLTVSHMCNECNDDLLPHESFSDEYVRRRTTVCKPARCRRTQKPRSNETLMERPLKSYRYTACNEPRPPKTRKRCSKCNKPKSSKPMCAACQARNRPPPPPPPPPPPKPNHCCPMCGLYGMIPRCMMAHPNFCIVPQGKRMACGSVKKKPTNKSSCTPRMVSRFPPECRCACQKKTPKPIFKIICRPRPRKVKNCPKMCVQDPCEITIHKMNCEAPRCRGGKLTQPNQIERSVLPHIKPVQNNGQRGSYESKRPVRRINSPQTETRPSSSNAPQRQSIRRSSTNNDGDDMMPSSSRRAQRNETQRNETDNVGASLNNQNAFYRGSFLQVRSFDINPKNRSNPIEIRKEGEFKREAPYKMKAQQLRSMLGVTQNSYKHLDLRKPMHNSTGFLVAGRGTTLRQFHSCCGVSGKSPKFGFKFWNMRKQVNTESHNIPSAPDSDEGETHNA